LLERAREIFKTEGLLTLVRRGLVFLVAHLFRYENYYLYQHAVGKGDEADFSPRVQNFTLKIVTTTQQADELAAGGFDFGSHHPNERRSLEKGAVAFCLFVDGELAHVGRVATSQEAKNSFDSLPYQVDFCGRQACTGGTWTNPRYRGRGLMTYGFYRRLEFLREHGMKSSRNAVAAGNIASQKVHSKFAPEVYARARYLQIFGWRLWKETPITGSPAT